METQRSPAMHGSCFAGWIVVLFRHLGEANSPRPAPSILPQYPLFLPDLGCLDKLILGRLPCYNLCCLCTCFCMLTACLFLSSLYFFFVFAAIEIFSMNKVDYKTLGSIISKDSFGEAEQRDLDGRLDGSRSERRPWTRPVFTVENGASHTWMNVTDF